MALRRNLLLMKWLVAAATVSNRRIIAFGVKVKDLRCRLLIVAESMQAEQQQQQGNSFGRLGPVHHFGAPIFGWNCRRLMHTAPPRVFGYHAAFENYYNRYGYDGVSEGMAA